MAQPTHLQKLPLAVESFEHLRATNQYYVDKTLLIRDVIREAGDPLLFTRPRRFGETLAMSMLRTFFEKTDRDTAIYFKGTNIEKAGAEILDHPGKYPVIYLSFKDAVGDSAQSILEGIREEIISEYRRHRNAIKNAGLDQDTSEEMRRFIFEEVNEKKVVRGVRSLAAFLHEFHGVKPVVLIDEYDVSIRRAWDLRFREPTAYDTVVSFMRRLLSSTFKSNFDISYSCLTGIERVAKAAGESGLNNLRVFGVLDKQFTDCFGFTQAETRAMLEAYGAADCYDEVCEWYQGYRFGDVEIFQSALRHDLSRTGMQSAGILAIDIP